VTDRPDAASHLVVVGATASGKSALALELARRRPGTEFVSADSMQVYRGMDIGTAKPTRAEQAEVPHHLIDLVDPSEDFAVAEYQAACRAALAGIEARGHRAVLVGGTGLYIRAVIDELTIPGQFPAVRAELEADPDTASLYRRLRTLDPIAAGRMEPTNRRRVVRALEVTIGTGAAFSSFGPGLEAYPPTRFVQVGIELPAAVLARRIEERYRVQLADGFLDEVRGLATRPQPLSRTAAQALGYKELLEHVEGRVTLADAVDLAERRTRRFARRQRTWFRRDPRITWLPTDTDPLTVLPALEGLARTALDIEEEPGGAAARLRRT
jgi:tRNA dimethylallyltransferase